MLNQALATHATCHNEPKNAQKRHNAITVPHVFRHSDIMMHI